MSKLVRARVKAVEHLPEWAKCCERMIQRCKETAEDEFNAIVGSDFVADEVECPFCHRIKRDTPYVRTTSGHVIGLEMYDLDEGPLEAA